jgi:hypothetical protein
VISRWNKIERKKQAEESKQRLELADVEYKRLEDMDNALNKKSNNPDMSPKKKVELLREYLDIQKKMGALPQSTGTIRASVSYHRNSLKAAQQLFKQNPQLTVSHLTAVLDPALYYSQSDSIILDDYDPSFYLRRCNNLSFFIKYLEKIMQCCPDEERPIIEYLPIKEDDHGIENEPEDLY